MLKKNSFRLLFSFVIAFMLSHAVLSQKFTCNCSKNDFIFPVMEEIYQHPKDNATEPIAKEVPDYFSWRDEGWTTPAKFQGMCGSCWAFAAIGALESVINIEEGLPELDPDLSEQYILSCLPLAGSCKGGHPYWAFYYMKSTSADGNYHNGALLEECFPYEGDDTIPCNAKCNDWLDKLVPIADFGYFFPDGSDEDRQKIKTLIMEKGPVVTFMMATEDFMKWGLENHSPDAYYPYEVAYGINHCVIIVGWKDDDSIPHGGYWICKNSWGKYWGYNGFFNIEYGSLNIDTFEIVWVEYDASQYDWPPVANAGKEYVGSVGEEIQFDGSKSKDVEGSIVSWQWNFGDGGIANGSKVSHSYDSRGIYSVSLEVRDESGKESTTIVPAFIDVWKKGEEWTYGINISIDMEGIKFDAIANKLMFAVKDESYNVKFFGLLKGDFDSSYASGKIPFALILGNLHISKNFSIESIDANVIGLSFVKTSSIPSLPVPFRIDVEITAEPSLHIIDFPLYVNKLWDSNLANISIQGYATPLFGFYKIPFEYSFYLGAMEGNCIGKEKVNVEAGSFEAYKISFFDFINIYYSYDVANIVKANVNYEGVEINAELKQTNYPQVE